MCCDFFFLETVMLLDRTEEKGGHTDLGIAPGWAEFSQTQQFTLQRAARQSQSGL